jgi:signal transduction histidine kinase
VWTLPAVATAVSIFAIQRAAGQEAWFPGVLLQQLWFYYLFATLCPFLYRVTGRLPFTRGRWPRAVAAHAAVAVVVVSAAMAFGAVVDRLVAGQAARLGEAMRLEFTTPQGQFRAIIYLFYYVAAAGAMVMVRLGRERRAEERRATKLAVEKARLESLVSRARLQTLEMELNPHFLFNALNSIASLAQQQRTEDAYRAITLLGDLLRETLRAGECPVVTLEEELSFLERYLELERVRFPDRLQVSLDVQTECRGATLPALLIQPLVENAVRHGLAKESRAMQLTLRASREDRLLQLEVRDDGAGLPEDWSPEGDGGVGLRNVRERLAAHYGDEALLSLDPGRSGGVVARVRLPFRAANGTQAS